MSNQITILQEINALIDKINGTLDISADKIADISKNARLASQEFHNIKTPRGLNEQLKKSAQYQQQLSAELKERNRLETALERQIARKNAVTSETNRQLVKTRFETQQLNREVKEQAILGSRIATEYQKLQTLYNKTGRQIQSLIAKEQRLGKLQKSEARQLKSLQAQYRLYETRIKKADVAIGRFQRNVGNYQSALTKATFAFRNFVGVFGVFSAGLIAQEIFETVKEIDALDKALAQVTETTERYEEAQNFLNNLADEAGVQINSLQRAYTKFLASAKETNLTTEETNDIFRQTAKAGAVLGLSTDQVEGAFRALEQIMSKGKVQAEEIRGQLGERLPGAFPILAKSMGLTTQELDKQLELGNVIADEVLPNFAKELEKAYSLDKVDRVETLNAAQNRLSNTWIEFVRSLEGSEGTLSKVFTFVINGLNSILETLIELNKTQEESNNDRYNSVLEAQADWYKRIGEEAAKADAEIKKANSQERINVLKQQIEEEQKIVDSLEEKHGWLAITRSEYTKNKNALEDHNEQLAFNEGLLEAAKRQLGESTNSLNSETDATKDNTQAKKDNNKERDETIKAIEGSEAYFKQQIRDLEEQQTKLATNSREWQLYAKQIQEAKDALELFQAEANGNVELISIDTPSIEEAAQNITDILNKPKEKIDLLGVDDFREQMAIRTEQLKEAQAIELQIAQETADLRRQLEESAYDAIGGIANNFFQAKIERYDADIQANNDYYSALLDNETLSEEQRDALEAERDRKNAEIERKKREVQRRAAIFEKVATSTKIIIDTAQKVAAIKAQAAVLAANPLTAALAPQALAQIPLVIGIGALALGQVATAPIPQFKDGHMQGTYEGKALINDANGSAYKEIVHRSNGVLEMYEGRNQVIDMKKGDKVIKATNAKNYLNNLSTQDLMQNLDQHIYNANMINQSYKIDNALNRVLSMQSLESKIDKLISVNKSKKTQFKLSQNISIADDLKFLKRKNNTL